MNSSALRSVIDHTVFNGLPRSPGSSSALICETYLAETIGDPFANKFKDSLEGIDDFADKSRASEIAICRAYGLDEPDVGWELFLSKRFRSSKKRRGAQELSDILLRKNSGPSFETSASNRFLSSSSTKSGASNLQNGHDLSRHTHDCDTYVSNEAGYNIHNEMINGIPSKKSKKFRKSIRRVRI